MNGEERNLTLQNSVLEWQKKYGIRDGDPMLASLELFHIYLRTSEPTPNGPHSPTFEEFRESLEILDQRTKAFVKLAGELIQELRKFPGSAKRMDFIDWLILLFLVLAAFAAGIYIGKFEV